MNTSDFLAGFAHPLSGADHILAMVAIGLWGVVAGGRALWAWPAAFVTMVVVGFLAETLGLRLPYVEAAIVSSVVVLGLLISLAVKAPVWSGALIAGVFAFFHGHAHGTEAAAAGLHLTTYAAGFVIATASLHALGLGAGFASARTAGEPLLRVTGGLIALGGMALMATPA